ncbi:Uncharacterized conserved protein [Amphritea atlantica]|uniref:Uncharacterized conserved protein n=1 Tax=Amphritea atlantica TaxID=355243 RepID=A0A1H9L279_9GAMM|nr:GFA family protein [Amphritea atlantica]SER05123.1 Uncharacterized conserved protein [Amphritea atlantica]
MSDTLTVTGQCLCGAVSMSTGSMSPSMGACHCSMCRTWTGGPLLAVDCAADLQISGAEYISRFQSSDWAERGFCSQCGTHLFYHLKQQDQYIVPIGFFAVDEGVTFSHQVFIDEKPEYYSFANVTKDMTGAEVFALYASE